MLQVGCTILHRLLIIPVYTGRYDAAYILIIVPLTAIVIKLFLCSSNNVSLIIREKALSVKLHKYEIFLSKTY